MNSKRKSAYGSIAEWKALYGFFAIFLLVILFSTSVPDHAAIAGDTERLAQCIATADLAAAAARSRDHGMPARQAKQAIASIDTTEAQLKEAIAIAYGADPLTPDQASRMVLQECLEAE
jgi:hypothetical protein